MRKYMLLMLISMLFAGVTWAGQSQYDIWASRPSISSTWTVAGISFYITPESTSSACSFNNYGSSMVFTTAGGLYPGSTTFVLTDANKNTVGELVTFMNSLSAGVLGIGNGITASLPQGVFENNLSTGLVINHTAIVSSNTVNVNFEDTTCITGMSYVLSAPSETDDSIWLFGVSLKAVSGGTIYCKIYDGDSSSDDCIYQEDPITSNTRTYLYIPRESFYNTAGTALRIDVYSKGDTLTDGYFNIFYKERH